MVPCARSMHGIGSDAAVKARLFVRRNKTFVFFLLYDVLTEYYIYYYDYYISFGLEDHVNGPTTRH